MRIKLTADSAIDLSSDLLELYDISLQPVLVMLGDKEHLDGIDICPEDIFSYVETTGKLPTTAAINPEIYHKFFMSFLDNGYDAVIHINISSAISSLHDNAVLGSATLDSVYVIDSKSLSSGSGLITMYIGDLIKQGDLNPSQIVKKALSRIPFVQASFIIDRLDFLHKGGRCSSIALLGANLLKIRPCIELEDGVMKVARKYRGKMLHIIKDYVKETFEKYNNPDKSRIIITHTLTDNTLVDCVEELVTKLGNFDIIYITDASCTITSHCGKNTIGIMYINDGGKIN